MDGIYGCDDVPTYYTSVKKLSKIKMSLLSCADLQYTASVHSYNHKHGLTVCERETEKAWDGRWDRNKGTLLFTFS